MLRLSLTILVIFAISSSLGQRERDGGRSGGGGRRVTTVDPITTSLDTTAQPGGGRGDRGRAARGRGGNQGGSATTYDPITTSIETTRRPGRSDRSRAARGRGGNQGVSTTTDVPVGGKGTGGKGTGGKGGATTTDVPETTQMQGGKGTGGKGTGGKGGNNGGTTTTEEPYYTTRRPRGRRGGRGGNNGNGGNGGVECGDALPQDESYDVLLDALFGNNGELVELGAQALEAYENTNGPNGYNDNVRGVMDDILATLLDYDFPDSLRILLSLQDGTVIYDSAQGDGNTWSASNRANNAERINENHNSRVAILVAQLSTCGVGYEQKLSSSTGNVEYYVAIRLFDQYASFGTVRVSYVNDYEDSTTTDAPETTQGGKGTGGKGGNGRRN